jgi:hypothetical protein
MGNREGCCYPVGIENMINKECDEKAFMCHAVRKRRHGPSFGTVFFWKGGENKFSASAPWLEVEAKKKCCGDHV